MVGPFRLLAQESGYGPTKRGPVRPKSDSFKESPDSVKESPDSVKEHNLETTSTHCCVIFKVVLLDGVRRLLERVRLWSERIRTLGPKVGQSAFGRTVSGLLGQKSESRYIEGGTNPAPLGPRKSPPDLARSQSPRRGINSGQWVINSGHKSK